MVDKQRRNLAHIQGSTALKHAAWSLQKSSLLLNTANTQFLLVLFLEMVVFKSKTNSDTSDNWDFSWCEVTHFIPTYLYWARRVQFTTPYQHLTMVSFSSNT